MKADVSLAIEYINSLSPLKPNGSRQHPYLASYLSLVENEVGYIRFRIHRNEFKVRDTVRAMADLVSGALGKPTTEGRSNRGSSFSWKVGEHRWVQVSHQHNVGTFIQLIDGRTSWPRNEELQ
jgi:hypothetical protein